MGKIFRCTTLLFLGILSSALFLSCSNFNIKKDIQSVKAIPSLFKGTQINNSNFSGPVWVKMLVENDTVYQTQVGNVSFEAGSKTKWHFHPGGQILLVTNGSGYYQEQGKPLKRIKEGDIIQCAPNVVHWHGASSNSSLTHIAISPNTQKGTVHWLDTVSKIN